MKNILRKQIKIFIKGTLILLLLNFVMFQSKAMIVFVNHAVFKNDLQTAFIELYLKIPVGSISLQKNTENSFYTSLNYNLKFSIGDSVYFYKSYNLISPQIFDTNNLNFALTDLKRISLPYNIYNLEVSIYDNFDSANKSTFKTIIQAKILQNVVSFSDVQFLDTVFLSKEQNKFSRSNYDLIPNVFNAFTDKQKRLYFYTEIYHLNQIIPDGQVFIRYYLKKDSFLLDGIEKIVKQQTAAINSIIGQLDISIIPEGVFELCLEVFSADNKLLKAKSAWFNKRLNHDYYMVLAQNSRKSGFIQLINAYNFDVLKKYISYLEIIASSSSEVNKIKLLEKETDKAELENFFYHFWNKRDSLNPLDAWLSYLFRVEDCNRQFGNTFREGYLSDRGKVYLQYGAPNSISESSGTMLAYPYQIWHYYSLPNNQQNKRFVFFNRSGALNEYELIHSNANGEINNPKWKEIISKFNNINPNDNRFFGDFLDSDFNE